jgi:ABC-2 type transport system ATP-binding protein
MSTSRRPLTLDLDRVLHRYGGRLVVPEMTLQVPPGRCVALAGPNGSGKSTLLRLAAGRERPTSGRVTWRGRPLLEDDLRGRRDLAVLPGPLACYPDLSVREHLELVRVSHGGRAQVDEVDEALALWRLDAHGDEPAQRLSAGQRQRMGLASLAVRPWRLALLDEPEQHLDSAGRRQLVGWLRDQVDAGRAILLASHEAQILDACAERVIWLDDGPRPPGQD